MSSQVKRVDCSFERHGEAVRDIFNRAIEMSTSLYEYEPRSLETIRAWFEGKKEQGYPIVGRESESGELMGFGSYGPFRLNPAYKYSIEHSIYVRDSYRRRRLGRGLLEELIQLAQQQGFHTLIGGIDSTNEASVQLHLAMGFQHCALIKQAGFKFGRWLDLEFYQLVLSTPLNPADG